MSEAKEKVVVGAGLAGMVAAVNLAKEGYQVTVLEAEARIGGSKQLHPSLHITPIHKKKVWEYIGIDLDECFVAPKTFRMYLGDLGFNIFPDDMSTVERGPRPSSVDTKLHELAVEAGVTFEFGHRVDRLEDLPPDTIIATGLDPRMFENLNLPYRDIPSRHVFKATELDGYGLGIFSEYASEYFYAAALHRLFYGMLPLEDPPNLNHLSSLVRDMKEWEKIDIPESEWRPVVFRVPLGGPANLRLFHQDKILAGTIAGMMDPFFLFGIHGALVSGRIAALTVMDREKGQAEFARVNRYFKQTFRAKQVYELLPVKAKLAIFKAMARAPYLFSPVIPLISRGIPGHDETDYFYRSFVGPEYRPPLPVRLAGRSVSALKRLVGKGSSEEKRNQE